MLLRYARIGIIGIAILGLIMGKPQPATGAQLTVSLVPENQLYLPVIMRNHTPGYGDVIGQVINATDGSSIRGAQVCIGGTCTTTGDNGEYALLGLRAGSRVAIVTANGYSSLDDVVYVEIDQTITVNFALSFALNIGEMRIILSWSSNPYWDSAQTVENDLDARMWVPDEQGDHTEVYWGNSGNCDLATPFACLEHDERLGSGPETTFISQIQPGIYAFFVENYAAGVAPTIAPPLPGTGAKVRVYDSSGLVRSYTVPSAPASNDYRYWYVFDIDGSNEGVIVDRNVITNTKPLPPISP